MTLIYLVAQKKRRPSLCFQELFLVNENIQPEAVKVKSTK